MNTSRILAALAIMAGISLTYGCGSPSFGSCRETHSCANAGGADGGVAGSSGAGGGSAGTAGSTGTDGGGGIGGTAGSGGSGGSPPVLLDNGATCSDGSSCKSSNCIDGVCCDTKCDGTCEACNLSGSEGTCTPYPSGHDPEKECLGSASAGDTCAGTCDGSGACTFPSDSTSCQNPTCSAGTATTYACAGDGSCKATQSDCGNYACGTTACRTSCTDDSQCATDAWCQGDQCVPKIADGNGCGGNNQCESGQCVSGTCCHTACAAPSTCGTGTCLCNGVTCGNGQTCITWYLDQDDDGYAASSSSDKAGCDNLKPADVSGHHYYATADDCDDQDPNAHPGQTGWFTSQSAGGTWDYNCDGSTEHQYPSGIGTIGTTCKSCGSLCANGTTWGYSCSGSCAATTKTYKITSLPSVACGQGAPLYTCTSSGETQSGGDVTEGCH